MLYNLRVNTADLERSSEILHNICEPATSETEERSRQARDNIVETLKAGFDYKTIFQSFSKQRATAIEGERVEGATVSHSLENSFLFTEELQKEWCWYKAKSITV